MSLHHTLDEELQLLEAQIMELTPAPLSENLLSRMEQAISPVAIDEELLELESQLAELTPAPLSENILSRMEQAIASATTQPTSTMSTNTLDEELQRLELQLAELSPAPLTDNILSRMEQTMASWETHLPVEEKIVPFQSNQPAKKKSYFHIWGAAAAVALMGTVGALFIGSDETEPNLALVTDVKNPVLTTSAPDAITENFSNNITNASNEGITLAGKNQTPYEVYRIEYTTDSIKLDQNGDPITVRETKVERVLKPIPVD